MTSANRWVAILLYALPLGAQQAADLAFQPRIGPPARAAGQGPRIAVDQAHHNFHTAQGRYLPFAALLRRDGFRVTGFTVPFTRESLQGVDILVIANALHPRNAEDWNPPNPSAFLASEIQAVHHWIEQGGSLFLIVDHMPFPGAADALAQTLGFHFSNGFAVTASGGLPSPFTFEATSGLAVGPATLGAGSGERVTKVVTFTGSAFRAPGAALPVLSLGPDHVSLEPLKPWEFTPATPRVPVDGWSQGALLEIGKGRVAVFGEAAMFTAQEAGPARMKVGMNAPGAEQNVRLLLNLVHWLGRTGGARKGEARP